MNIRVVLLLWLLLGFPVWRSLLGGTIDPDTAAIKLGIAGVVAVAVEILVRGFVRAAAPAEPTAAESSPDDDADKARRDTTNTTK